MNAVAISNRIVDMIVWCTLWITIGIVAGSCAHSRTPYTDEIPVGEFVADWTGDESASVLRVVNPLGSPVSVVVACAADSGAVDRWSVDVAPRGSTTVLFQKLAKNWATEMCMVETWSRRQ